MDSLWQQHSLKNRAVSRRIKASGKVLGLNMKKSWRVWSRKSDKMGFLLKHTFKATSAPVEGKMTDTGVEFLIMTLPRGMGFCSTPQGTQQIMTFADSKEILH